MRPARPAVPAALALAVAFATLSGCGALFGGRYNNFRAYYNTYYNATRSLEEGERALLNTTTPVDRSRLVELFPTGGAGGSNTTFDLAISKSAELLRQRPDSKWADDALLVIGKAYFYERNFAGAEQKFRETIAAAGVADDRRLADEARFWLGRTLAAADRYDEGVLALREALQQPDGNRYWQARMHLALGELNARAGRWDAATVDLRDGLDAIRDADLGARAALLLGQVEEAAGRYDAAADAYELALDRRPAYEIAFAAEINRGLVLGLDAGRAPDGLAVLDGMARDDKNFQRRAEVALAQARVLAAADRPDDAEARFRTILYDPDLAGQAQRGEAHYRLAEFYRDVRGDYVTAAAHFDTAATSISNVPTAAQRPSRAAILGTTTLASTYQTVARTSLRIAAIDSVLALGALDDDAFAARIAEIESVRRAEWVRERREADALRAVQDFGGTGSIQTPFGQEQRGVTNQRGVNTAAGTAGRGVNTPGQGGSPADAAASTVATGYLGYRDPRTLQSGQLEFQRIYGDRPLVPNWRRRSALQGVATSSGTAGSEREDFTPGATALAGPPPLDLSDIPRTPAARSALELDRAALRYELANTFFLALDRPDRAAVLYRQILAETPDAPVAPRTRYALAELEAGAGQDASALYRDVAESDSASALGRAARARLEGRDPEEAAPAVTDDADDRYAAARTLWDDGDPLGAARALVLLGDADPSAPGAPRAFLAAALAYADTIQRDSVALAAPMPQDLVPAALFADAAPPATPAPAASSTSEVTSVGASPASSAVPDDVEELQVRRGRTVRPRLAGAPAPVGTPETVEGGAPVPLNEGEPSAAPESVSPSPSPVPAVPDTTATAAAPASLTLREYLMALARRYPGTPVASRAQAIASSLPAPAVAPAEVLADAVPAPGVTREEFGGMTGRAPLNLSLGGVSWVIGPFETEGAAREKLGTLPVARIRFAIATDDQAFVLLFGHFPDAAAAEEAAETAPAAIIQEATVTPVAPYHIVEAANRPLGTPLPPPPAAPASSVQDAAGTTSLPTLTPPSDEAPAPPLDPAPPTPTEEPTDTPLPGKIPRSTLP